MSFQGLNTNIDGAAAPAFVAALAPVAVASGFVASVGFAGRIDRALNNGCSRLRLNLGQDFGHSLLRNRPRSDRHGGKRGYLHDSLPGQLPGQLTAILAKHGQKIINHFMLGWIAYNSLILNLFNFTDANITGLHHADTRPGHE